MHVGVAASRLNFAKRGFNVSFRFVEGNYETTLKVLFFILFFFNKDLPIPYNKQCIMWGRFKILKCCSNMFVRGWVNLGECSPKPTVTIRFYSRLFYVLEKVMNVGGELSETHKKKVHAIHFLITTIPFFSIYLIGKYLFPILTLR